MIAQLGAQPVSVQLSHDREGDGRFHDGADALGAWGRRIPLAAGLLQGGSGRPRQTSSIPGTWMWNRLHDSLRDAAAQNVLNGIRIHQFPQDFDKSVRPAQKCQQTPFRRTRVAGAPPLLRSDSFQKEPSMSLRQQAARTICLSPGSAGGRLCPSELPNGAEGKGGPYGRNLREGPWLIGSQLPSCRSSALRASQGCVLSVPSPCPARRRLR